MLKIVSLLPLLAAIIAVLFFGGTVWLQFFGHWGWALLTSTFTTIFGLLAYIGFRVQRKVDSTVDTAMEVAGNQVERVADAVIERVKK